MRNIYDKKHKITLRRVRIVYIHTYTLPQQLLQSFLEHMLARSARASSVAPDLCVRALTIPSSSRRRIHPHRRDWRKGRDSDDAQCLLEIDRRFCKINDEIYYCRTLSRGATT